MFSEFCSVTEQREKDVKPCIFPFTYEGVTYNNCTVANDPDNMPWCSTKVDEDGNHVKAGRYWGHCDPDCNEISAKEKPEFAFVTKGQKYFLNSCKNSSIEFQK